jgi:RimJ/RimL family protein N-acetyltransferase
MYEGNDMVVFETERLDIRRWREDDAERLFEMFSNPEVTRFVPSAHVKQLDEMVARMPRILGAYERYGDGFGVWAGERKDDGHVVGMVLLKHLPDAQNELTDDIEVGWHLAHEDWKKGYATEMGAGALKHGFQTQGLERIYAIADPENLASLAVMERIGMTRIGMTDSYYGAELGVLYAVDAD